jgi:membrane-bound lytic murein transglycosylase A
MAVCVVRAVNSSDRGDDRADRPAFGRSRTMSRFAALNLCLLTVLALASCEQPGPKFEPYQPPSAEGKDYSRPLPPGQLALRKIDPSAYPDFGPGFAERAGLEEAIQHSLAWLRKPSSRKYFPYGEISHEHAGASLEHFLRVLRTARSGEELNAIIRAEFDVYQSVGCDDRGTVLYTGYYTPIFDGRLQRDAEFRYPLYRLPPDVVKDEEGRILGRRRPDGSLTPYFTRRELEEQRLLDGLELAYLRDPFAAYVANVQGSAKLRLADGRLYELGYAGNNGHEYVSITRAMLADGVLRPEEISLQKLLTYFQQHPERTFHYTWKNPRYVFFTERPGGPFGALNTPVTPMRTIATDKEIYPRACLAFVRTQLPRRDGATRNGPYAGFFLDQDAGGAIRAPGRCDLYIGIGPQAEAVAGRTLAEGNLYYLFSKRTAAPADNVVQDSPKQPPGAASAVSR